MKRSVIIVIAVVLLLLATVRLVLKTKNEIDSEKVSYVRDLDYNFSAEVDSIVTVGKKGRGFLVCRLIEGNVNPTVEDRLNQQLTHYEWMRFLFFKPNGQPQIFLENISNYRAGDSVSVNSRNDKFVVYRNGSTIFESAITHATWQKMSYDLW
jgi:hypothetical protein